MTKKKSATKTALRKPVRAEPKKSLVRVGAKVLAARGALVRKVGKGARPAAEPPRVRPKSPFNKKELDEYRGALMNMRYSRIGDKESREKEALKAAGQDVSVDHMADFGSDNYEQEFTLGLLEQDVETLRDINDALGRILEGTFGLCEECDKPIPKARLKVIPHARLCVDCKSKEE